MRFLEYRKQRIVKVTAQRKQEARARTADWYARNLERKRSYNAESRKAAQRKQEARARTAEWHARNVERKRELTTPSIASAKARISKAIRP